MTGQRRDRAGDAAPLSGSLARVVASLGGPELGLMRRVEQVWAEVAPAEVAARTRAVAIVDGRLVVTVDEPAAAAALRWHGPRLLAAVSAAAETSLRDLVVRVRSTDGAGADPR